MSEVLFEFITHGNSVKVSAIDVETNTEAVVIVPANISQNDMKKHALQKLRYILEKESKK